MTIQLIRRQPSFTVTALDGAFPDQPVGTVGPARRFVVQNTGTADGDVGFALAATLTRAASNGEITGADYLLGATYCVGATLTPTGQCVLRV